MFSHFNPNEDGFAPDEPDFIDPREHASSIVHELEKIRNTVTQLVSDRPRADDFDQQHECFEPVIEAYQELAALKKQTNKTITAFLAAT